MMMMTPLRRTSKKLNLQISHQIVPVAILNFLMRWSFCQRRCVRIGVLSVPWMRKNQSHVSDLFILDFVIIIFVFVKALFSICLFYSMLSFSYPCFICYFWSLVCDYIIYINHFCGIILGGFSIIRIFVTNCKWFITFYYETISWYDSVHNKVDSRQPDSTWSSSLSNITEVAGIYQRQLSKITTMFHYPPTHNQYMCGLGLPQQKSMWTNNGTHTTLLRSSLVRHQNINQ